jgi:CobQ-like glutamine amidotransferase family enzyme
MANRTTDQSLRRSAVKLKAAHLYPDLMSVYGDRGNVMVLAQRAAWRDIELEVIPVTLGDAFPSDVDLVFFGGGQDREQVVVSADFVAGKGPAVVDAVNGGAALLSICGGYQLLGASYTTFEGQELPGAGLFDIRSTPGPKRHIGNVLIQTELDGVSRTLVGFENHSGRTYLGQGVQPLGKALVGAGNNGEDGTEGAVHLNAYGCYLHGSLLPKNPWLADRLLLAAIRRQQPDYDALPPLDDRIENDAHRAVEGMIRAGRRVKSGAW